jgi:hypothetical protein
MKTENDYADYLIDKYKELTKYGHWDDCIKCAIIDVTNTIEALTELTCGNYTDELLVNQLEYYNNVLQILKDKL